MAEQQTLVSAPTPISPPPVAEPAHERPLPKRDIWLLPAISIATILLLFAGSEVTARSIWSESQGPDPCTIEGVPGVAHYKANCTSMVKSPETPWVQNVYNECGYRSSASCGPKPAGTDRIAVLGSSSSFGYMDRYEDVYSTRLAELFTHSCGRKFEFQNLGYEHSNILGIYRQMNEALALKPNVILVVLSPIDLRGLLDGQSIAHRDDPPGHGHPENTDRPESWLHQHVIVPLQGSRAVYMLQSAMYHSPETFLKLYLLHGDDAGFLKSPFPPVWQKQFSQADFLLGEMAKKANAASVPMVLVTIPYTADVAAFYSQSTEGVAPEAFPKEMASIAARDDIPEIDAIDPFAGRSNPMGYFYVADGHLNASGEKVLADSIASRLPTLVPTVFRQCKAGSRP